ncbi:MAG: efflux RND transporter periplasmic adaptor subunit [Prevotellaceae bacterium]|jgi:membrane fusion protein (multidrug efflux system)|nr:efflux RND transporter periplasmic adaptor subunit [Prevotellaceae bacterium]
MKKGAKRFVVITIIVVIVVIIAYPKIKPMFSSSDNGGGAQSSAGRRALNVKGEVLRYQQMAEQVRSTGTLSAEEDVELSFEAAGKLIKIDFVEGSRVQKGQLLAKVNDAPLQAQLQKLQAQLKLAEERLYRQNVLLERDAISREAYDQAVTETETLNADIALVEARIAETELRAPFDGIIGLRYVSEGAYVTTSTKIVRLVKLNPIKIDFSIPGQYANDVQTGDIIRFSVQTGDRIDTYSAPVYAVEPEITTDTRSLVVRARSDNSNERLIPGMYASVELTLASTNNAIAVPSESIVSELGVSKVFLYRDGVAVSQEITPGMRTESHVQVLEGVNIGDTLITSGILQLRENMPVELDALE